eukprot:3718030-Prymnesium_polylepis.1
MVEELIGALSEMGQSLTRAQAQQLSKIAWRHGKSIDFHSPARGNVHTYEVTMLAPFDMRDGEQSYQGPMETGGTMAHRLLGDRLLRVRFEERAECSRDRISARKSAMSHSITVAGRKYVHFTHKDVDKGEGRDGEKLWVRAHMLWNSDP